MTGDKPYKDGGAVIRQLPSMSFTVSRDFGNQFSFLKEVTIAPRDVGQFSGTVVLLHGYGAKKESWMSTGFYFQALGFRVIEPDLVWQTFIPEFLVMPFSAAASGFTELGFSSLLAPLPNAPPLLGFA